MEKEEKIPNGYIEGLARHGNPQKSHLFKGTFNDPGKPMCQFGYDRPDGSYSIARGNRGKKGVCKICLARARKGEEGVDYKERRFPINVGD